MSYTLEGSLLEVCNCDILCPCWVGEDPDPGTCDSIVAYHVDSGAVNGTDVSGRTMALLCHLPGNVLNGNWKVVMIVDDKANGAQQQALVDLFSGKLGGPLADYAQLIGEVVAVERMPVLYEIHEGKGTLKIGSIAEADMEPYRSPAGNVTTLNESAFSTIPGSPAWVAKASKYIRKTSAFGLKDLELSGKNAIQGTFRFAA
ncbi:MAG TPA: DUF1326 domain-containing protein [Dehalococcoidia bacterium]|nr:DUF1326 domain-containing protein [Dehalococcoidia bacterium]